jgi:hypothetical protein
LDSFTFKANDAVKDSNTATVTINVVAATGNTLLVNVELNQALYAKGQPLNLAVDIFNHLNPPLESTLALTIIGPNNYYHFDSQSISISTNSFQEYIFEWVVPNITGTYVVEVSLVPAQLTSYDSAGLKVI